MAVPVVVVMMVVRVMVMVPEARPIPAVMAAEMAMARRAVIEVARTVLVPVMAATVVVTVLRLDHAGGSAGERSRRKRHCLGRQREGEAAGQGEGCKGETVSGRCPGHRHSPARATGCVRAGRESIGTDLHMNAA